MDCGKCTRLKIRAVLYLLLLSLSFIYHLYSLFLSFFLCLYLILSFSPFISPSPPYLPALSLLYTPFYSFSLLISDDMKLKFCNGNCNIRGFFQCNWCIIIVLFVIMIRTSWFTSWFECVLYISLCELNTFLLMGCMCDV